MKFILLELPETLDEYREMYKNAVTREIPVQDDEPYNTRTVGWYLNVQGKTHTKYYSPSLIGAYKNLFLDDVKQLMRGI